MASDTLCASESTWNIDEDFMSGKEFYSSTNWKNISSNSFKIKSVCGKRKHKSNGDRISSCL